MSNNCVRFYLHKETRETISERSYIMTKRIFSILLASIMCLSLSVTALAAESEEYVLPTEYGNCGSIVLNDNGEGVVEIPMSSNTIPSIIPLGGGTETWSTTGKKVLVGSFSMEGNNLTPVKTIGVNGYNIGIYTDFSAS